MPHNPKLDGLHYGYAVAKKTILWIRELVHQIPRQPDLKLSRSAALRILEELILEESEDEARARMLSDPAGTLSLLWLARKYEEDLDMGRYMPEQVEWPTPHRFRIFAEWLYGLTTKFEKRENLGEDETP